MGDDSLKSLMIGFILFGLFAVLVSSFLIEFGSINDFDMTNVTGSGGLNIGSINASTHNSSSTADTYRSQFESGDFSDIDSPTGIFSVMKNIIKLVFSPFTFFGNVAESIGIPLIFINIVLTIVILIIILGIWRVIRTGS